MCPIAARKRSTSSASVAVWASSSGSASRVRIASSQTASVTTSTMRPRIENPVLQYDIVAPSGCTCVTAAQLST